MQPSYLQRAIMSIGGQLPRNWLGRRVAALLRSMVRRMPRQSVDVERFGFQICLNLRDNACERRLMVTPQFFEPEMIAFLASKITEDYRFVDVGANVGIYSLFVAARAPKAKILAIEPQEVLCARLAHNSALNDYEIAIERCAVSDYNGRVLMAIDDRNRGASRIDKISLIKTFVPCRKLLDVITEHVFEHIDAMKIDIEGHEEPVWRAFLEEAPHSLWPDYLIVEMHDTPKTAALVAELTSSAWNVILSPPGWFVLGKNLTK